MKAGTYVQHRTRSEWGIGCVLHRAGDRAQVQFNHGLVLLDLRVAGPLFMQVPAPPEGTITPPPPARKTPVRARKPRK